MKRTAGAHDDHLTFEIAPRDERMLRLACERFVPLAGGVGVQRFDAARALSYMADDAAIDCMREVLQATKNMDFIMFTGLVRIGSEQARAVLSEMTTSTDRERSALARDALRRLGSSGR